MKTTGGMVGFPAMARRSAGLLALGAVTLTVAGIGIARAATDQGGIVLGGVANHTTKPTGFVNKKGPALALKSNKHKPPFTVNSSKLVKHLNAAKVGGQSAGQLATRGSAARSNFPPGLLGQYTTTPTALVTTATLPKGTYYVTGTTSAHVSTNNAAVCGAATSTPDTSFKSIQAYATSPDVDMLTAVVQVTLTAPGKIGWYCWISGGGPTSDTYYYAAISAIRVAHSATGSAAAGVPTA
jgi:hypothetical protein